MSDIERSEAEEALWDIWEFYLETKLFRDANILEVNRLLNEMHQRVLGVFENGNSGERKAAS